MLFTARNRLRRLLLALAAACAGSAALPDGAPGEVTLRAAPAEIVLPAAESAPEGVAFTARVSGPAEGVGGVRIRYRFFLRASPAAFTRVEQVGAAVAARPMARRASGESAQGRVTFYQDVLRRDEIPANTRLADLIAEAQAFDGAGNVIQGTLTTVRVPVFDPARQPVLRLVSPEPGAALIEGWQRFVVAVEADDATPPQGVLAFCPNADDLLEAALPAVCRAHALDGQGRVETLVELPRGDYWWGVRAYDDAGSLAAVSTAWPVKVRAQGSTGRAPTQPTPTGAPEAAAAPITESITWGMEPNRAVFYLPVDAPGEVVASLAWGGSQRDLAVTLDAPGRATPYARREGAAPLQMRYTVTQADLDSAPRLWRLTIRSSGAGVASSGALALLYPGGAYTGLFNLAPEVGALTAVVPVAGAGGLSAVATWTGAPSHMALQLNGPERLEPYARAEGRTPLRVDFSVEAFDLARGESWGLSVIAFARPSASGVLTFAYPGAP